jgi:two-component system chemotaxis response regulator CheY
MPENAATAMPQILIVDDDAATRDALGAFLEVHGYSPVLAADGAEGLRKLRAGLRPRMILLDLMMPEKNGFQFRVEQVADPALADIPVVIYSGNTEARSRGAELGVAAYLPKPIDVDTLLGLVQAHCAGPRSSESIGRPA